MVNGKKAVVLGVGAEKGLGAAASRRFAKEGHHVLVAGRTAAKTGKVADAIRAAAFRDHFAAAADPSRSCW